MKHDVKALAKVIKDLRTTEEVIDFLEGILTPKELSDVAQRLQIIKMLKKGIPQRLIVEELGVGIATVTRGSKELQLGKFKHV